MDVKAELRKRVARAVSKVAGDVTVPHIPLDNPKVRDHGDYATNVALVMAKLCGRKPMDLAEEIAREIGTDNVVSRVEVKAPGFVNFFVAEASVAEGLRHILQEGDDYGRSVRLAGQRVLVEFVSANPTGPLHTGHARNAVVGDSIARALEWSGATVQREYYFNDAGVQMERLGNSVKARYMQITQPEYEFPEDAYHGDYVKEIAAKLEAQHGRTWESAPILDFARFAETLIVEMINDDLARMGIRFDSRISETSFHNDGQVDGCLARLAKAGATYEKDGAVWLRTVGEGDEEDRVIVKTDGNKTYLAPDLAYHEHKFKRGYDLIVNLFGADHHNYAIRLKAAVRALGYDPEKLKIVIYQLVTVRRNGEVVRFSKRAGDTITLKEMLDGVGADALRFFFNLRKSDSHMEFDWDLAKEQSSKNPVFYVQYAHARCCSIERKAKELGIEFAGPKSFDANLLSAPEEQVLMRTLLEFPRVVESVGLHLEPHQFTTYARTVAEHFNAYFTSGTNDHSLRVVQPTNAALTQARLALIYSTRQVLRNALSALGVSAPETM